MKTSVLYAQAFKYVEVDGFSIIPVGKDKRPLLGSWKEYQTRKPTIEEVEAWWKKYPEANIGIVTGKISGITVVDVDTYHGGDPKPFPSTYTVRTGNGGLQLYYKYNPGMTISANGYANMPGVDIRGDGGYVVAPPSITDYVDKGVRKGGPYSIDVEGDFSPFPVKLFPATKTRRTLSTQIGAKEGSRNDTIASFAGMLLSSRPEKEWETEVWQAVLRANKTFEKVLSETEVRTTFDSIKGKEIERRKKLIVSPMQIAGGEDVEVNIRRNRSGTAYKDMANVLSVLESHPYYKNSIKFNEFRQEIEYNGKPFEESDLIKIQFFMQTDAELHCIAKEAVYSAVTHYAYKNKYDEAQDWVKSLEWDGVPRLANWVSKATGVEDESYHSGVGAQWVTGIIKRIMKPGCTFDYMLVLVGPQGIGKTSFFRIMGGPWYKSYTGAMDNKDFFLALRGAVIVDLDEGAALYRSEAIKIKSIITETHDEFRAPYDRVMKKYPRRFVFSMSTNDTEPFRDVTGNRRYWTIDGASKVDFKWLEENRDQIYAEAYYCYKNDIAIPEVPSDKALANQEAHLPDDSWAELVMAELKKSPEYRKGVETFEVTTADLYGKIFGDNSLAHLGRTQEMRIATILNKTAGLEKLRKMEDGERKVRWVLRKERAKELQTNNLKENDF